MSGGGKVKPCVYANYADLVPALLVLKAEVILYGKDGESMQSLAEFLNTVKRFGIAPGMILKEIRFKVGEGLKFGYATFTSNRSMGVTLGAAAVCASFTDQGTLADMALSVGGASIQKIATAGMEMMNGSADLTGQRIEIIAESLAESLQFEDNLLYSQDYTAGRVKLLIAEVLKEAAE